VKAAKKSTTRDVRKRVAARKCLEDIRFFCSWPEYVYVDAWLLIIDKSFDRSKAIEPFE
jgi:hypothetical protein